MINGRTFEIEVSVNLSKAAKDESELGTFPVKSYIKSAVVLM